MSFVALHHHAGLTLSTDRLLLPAGQAQSFETAHALADALALLRDSEHERIDAAHRAARAAGHAEGFAAGMRQAQRAGAEQLAEAVGQLAAQAHVDHAALRDAVLKLAPLIVRRIAAGLPRAELVSALAQQAFDHLALSQAQQAGAEQAGACVVRVHPQVMADVRARVEQRGAPMPIEWRSDETLAPLDCVIDTPNARLLAGLEAQLDRVSALLRAPAESAARQEIEA